MAEGSAPDLPGVVSVPNGEPHAMAAAIRALLDDPDKREELGREGRSHVRAACTWAARARELEAIYGSLVCV